MCTLQLAEIGDELTDDGTGIWHFYGKSCKRVKL